MKMKIKALLLVVILVLTMVLSPLTVLANSTLQSNVMADLTKDSSFDISNYPLMTYESFKAVNADSDPDNNVDLIRVIQIAESEDNELFIYTYQPLNDVSDITASSINFATEESGLKDMAIKEDMTDFKKYDLECVSADGSLKKYLVKDFEVGNDFYRYYCISEIERPYDDFLDGKNGDIMITNYKAHAVGQAWCCYYYDNTLKYEMVTLDLVEITPICTDEIYCENGLTLGSLVGINEACVSHYIAFNIDNYKVDKIIDASLVYKYREYRTVDIVQSGLGPAISSIFGKDLATSSTLYPKGTEYKTQSLDIYKADIVKYEGKGLWANEYSWNRIMTGVDFVKNVEDQGGAWDTTNKTIVSGSQYVFAFCETGLTSTQTFVSSGSDIFATTTYTTTIEGTEIAEVDILRLKFVSNGVPYNLGVVSDTTSSDGKPGAIIGGLDFDDKTIKEWLELILKIFLTLVLIVFIVNVVAPLAIPIIKLIVSTISSIVSLVISILLFPFTRNGRSK